MIAAVLVILLGLLFYVGRMLFLAAGTPGGNFDAPGDPSDLSSLADAANSSAQHAYLPDAHSHSVDGNSHESGGFDGDSSSHH